MYGGYRYGNRDVHYTGDGRVDPRDLTFPRQYGGRAAPYADDFRSYDRDRELRRVGRQNYPDVRHYFSCCIKKCNDIEYFYH